MWQIILGTFCYIAAFPTYNLWWLAYFALPLWVMGLRLHSSPRHLWRIILIVNFMIGIGGFHWITYTMQEFGGMPLPLAIGMLFLFCLIAAPQFTCFALLFQWRRNFIASLSASKQVILLSALYCALEFLARQIKIFPEQIGATQIPFTHLIQNASWGGVSAISFFVAVWGLSLLEWRSLKIRLVFPLLATLVALVFGAWEISRIEKKPFQPLRVAILQGNIGNLDKIVSESGDLAAIDKVLTRYFELMRENSKDTDLLIWPETAYPLSYPTSEATSVGSNGDYYARQLQAEIKKPIQLFFGGYESNRRLQQDFNSAILADANAKIIGAYQKRSLLILGEYMPLANLFPSLKNLNPQMGDFTPGPGAHPIYWPEKNLRIAANICYEALLPEYMRQFALAGAQVFLNLTNDSWFGPGMEPYQHLQLSVLRTIENRIPMIRATNTGISVTIDVFGKIRSQGPLYEPAAIRDSLPIPTQPIFSLYKIWGETFAWLLVVCSSFYFLRGPAASWRVKFDKRLKKLAH